MTLGTKILLIYAAVISLVAFGAAVYDKIAAKSMPKNRVPENTLIYLGILGGAPVMYITMLIIRHKTRHKKFMIGLPVIIVIQAILIFAAVFSGIFSA